MLTTAAPLPDDKKSIIQVDAKEKPNDRHPVDQICDAVTLLPKKAAIVAIRHILQSFNINVYHAKTKQTAVSQLVANGLMQEADFLRKKFNASSLDILRELAKRDPDAADAFFHEEIAICPSMHHALLEKMAQGLAWGGHAQHALSLLDRSDVRKKQSLYNQLLMVMARFFALIGDEKNAYLLLDKSAAVKDSVLYASLLKEIAYGFAQGGFGDKAFLLLNRKEVHQKQELHFSILENMALILFYFYGNRFCCRRL